MHKNSAGLQNLTLSCLKSHFGPWEEKTIEVSKELLVTNVYCISWWQGTKARLERENTKCCGILSPSAPLEPNADLSDFYTPTPSVILPLMLWSVLQKCILFGFKLDGIIKNKLCKFPGLHFLTARKGVDEKVWIPLHPSCPNPRNLVFKSKGFKKYIESITQRSSGNRRAWLSIKIIMTPNFVERGNRSLCSKDPMM